jgi:membrane peptidoglycan carboxypeptidase
MALGTSESTLLEMTGAYAGILNEGIEVTPYGVIELTLQGDKTPLIVHSSALGQRVISQQSAQQLTYMMNQVVENGSGRKAQILGVEIAGKTGTTQGAKDAWFIAFTNDYVVGVWMGYDDNTKLTGVTGGGLPTDIWRETMERILGGDIPAPLPMIIPQEQVVIEGQKIVPGSEAQNSLNESPRDLSEQFGQNLKKLDRDAESVLKKVLDGIFGRKN